MCLWADVRKLPILHWWYKVDHSVWSLLLDAPSYPSSLPPNRLGVYLACPSMTAWAMNSVNFASVAGANWSSSVNFIFYCFSQNSCSSSNKFLPCQSYLPTHEFFKTKKKLWRMRSPFIFTFLPRRRNFLLSILEFGYYWHNYINLCHYNFDSPSRSGEIVQCQITADNLWLCRHVTWPWHWYCGFCYFTFTSSTHPSSFTFLSFTSISFA